MTTEYKVYKPTNTDSTKDELRRRAVKRLQAKAGFWTHFAVYLAVNAFLVCVLVFGRRYQQQHSGGIARRERFITGPMPLGIRQLIAPKWPWR